MQLYGVKIHNFRSIKHAEFITHSYTLLAGANNSGKSTIVDALRIFYEHEKYKYKGDRDRPRIIDPEDEASWIELEFTLSDEEADQLPEKYRLPDNRLLLHKWLAHVPDGWEEGTIYGYEINGALSADSLFGAPNVQKGKLGTLIYIPAVSKVDEHTKLSGPSALKNTIDELLGAVISDSPDYEKFRNEFETFSDAIRDSETEDGRSLRGFEAHMSKELSSWEAGFKLNFSPPSTQEITKNLINWELTDDDGRPSGHGIELFGSGFQRHFIASLIRTRAAFQTPPKVTKRKQFSPDLTLILFEEPEAYLHPPQQLALSKNLRDVVKTGNWQVIASTHSPHFVSRNTDDLGCLVRIRRDEGVSTSYQLSEEDIESIFSAREELESILGSWNGLDENERADLERIRFFLWLDNERSSLFFVDFVLLVEGATESALLARLIDDDRLILPVTSCGILHSDGKYNTVRFMRLLSALGMPFVVIHDKDTSDVQLKLNKLIQDEAAVSSFAKGVVVLDPDLEGYLGWKQPKGNYSGLKPGVALLNYEQHGGTCPKLDDLCESIRQAVT